MMIDDFANLSRCGFFRLVGAVGPNSFRHRSGRAKYGHCWQRWDLANEKTS